jgi:hypothetical protein
MLSARIARLMFTTDPSHSRIAVASAAPGAMADVNARGTARYVDRDDTDSGPGCTWRHVLPAVLELYTAPYMCMSMGRAGERPAEGRI